jgi:NitT/TauT family transport system substrate-binding protein
MTSARSWAWAALLAPLLFAAPSPAETLSVSQYGQVNADLPWAIALKKGFFKDEGVNIDRIIPGQGGGTALRNMLASDLPYGVVATSAALAGIRAGVDLKIVNSTSDNIGEIALVTLPDSPLRSIKDLAGKKIAITSPKSTTEWMTRMVLEKNGIPNQAQIVPAGGFAPALTALAQHAVDAAPLNDPGLTLKAEKYRVRDVVGRRDHAAVPDQGAGQAARHPEGLSARRRFPVREPRGGDAHLRRGVGAAAR